jgi:hypothetical protein
MTSASRADGASRRRPTYLAKRAGQSADAAERALVHARRAENRFEEREVVEWLVIALLLGPAPAAEASGRCARLLEESAVDPPLEVQVLGRAGPPRGDAGTDRRSGGFPRAQPAENGPARGVDLALFVARRLRVATGDLTRPPPSAS